MPGSIVLLKHKDLNNSITLPSLFAGYQRAPISFSVPTSFPEYATMANKTKRGLIDRYSPAAPANPSFCPLTSLRAHCLAIRIIVAYNFDRTSQFFVRSTFYQDFDCNRLVMYYEGPNIEYLKGKIRIYD